MDAMWNHCGSNSFQFPVCYYNIVLAPNTSATVLCKHHYNALHCYCNDTFFVAEVSSFSEVVLFLKAKTIEYCKADIFVGQNFVDHNSQKLPPPPTPTQKNTLYTLFGRM